MLVLPVQVNNKSDVVIDCIDRFVDVIQLSTARAHATTQKHKSTPCSSICTDQQISHTRRKKSIRMFST
jgi:hypothetical protein